MGLKLQALRIALKLLSFVPRSDTCRTLLGKFLSLYRQKTENNKKSWVFYIFEKLHRLRYNRFRCFAYSSYSVHDTLGRKGLNVTI